MDPIVPRLVNHNESFDYDIVYFDFRYLSVIRGIKFSDEKKSKMYNLMKEMVDFQLEYDWLR